METIASLIIFVLFVWLGYMAGVLVYTILHRRDGQDDDEVGGWGR